MVHLQARKACREHTSAHCLVAGRHVHAATARVVQQETLAACLAPAGLVATVQAGRLADAHEKRSPAAASWVWGQGLVQGQLCANAAPAHHGESQGDSAVPLAEPMLH